MLQTLKDLFMTTTKDGELTLTTMSIVLLLLLIGVSLFLVGKTSNKKSSYIKTNQLVFASASIALATVLSFIRPISLPYGGSITMFSMFFITFIGSLYGFKLGVVTGIAYGILQFILDPVIVHPMQILFDYPVAFGALGLSGFFLTKDSVAPDKKNYFYTNLISGYFLGVLGRYFAHSLSGYIFFQEYVPVGNNAILYTLTYNLTYIAPEAIFTSVILLLPPIKHMVHQLRKSSRLS